MNKKYSNASGIVLTPVSASLSPFPQTSPSKYPSVVADTDIVKAYSAVSGYNPSTGLNDNGAACLDVLNYWRNTGIAGHKIAAYAKIDVKNIPHIQAAIYLFGGIYTGFSLPLSAQNQAIWDVPPTGAGSVGSGAPGSWGGHCIPLLSYTQGGFQCITWGEKKQMTLNFFIAYCSEAYAIISPDFVGQKTPSGFDLVTLQKDLQQITAK